MKALFEKIRRALRAAWEFVRTLGVLRLGTSSAEDAATDHGKRPAPSADIELDESDDDDIDGDGPAPLTISAPTPTVAAS